MIEGVKVSKLKIIEVHGGNVLHALKASESDFSGFGEAYFSMIDFKIIKGWKRHKKMTLNLVVPIGSIRFILFDSRVGSPTFGDITEIILSNSNYSRLKIPPMVWFGFQGMEMSTSMLLNIANIPHNKSEIEEKSLDEINFDWRLD